MNDNKSVFDGKGIQVGHNETYEEEAALDQVRRHNEIADALPDMFADLDDDNSICSNSQFGDADQRMSGDTGSPVGTEQLQGLYECRMKQIEDLKFDIDALRRVSEKEISQLKNKLIISDAEKQRANLSLKQAQALNAEFSSRIAELEKEIARLKEKIEKLENKNESLEKDVTYWRNSSNDLNVRIRIMERGLGDKVDEKTITEQFTDKIKKLEEAINNSYREIDIHDQRRKTLEKKLQEAEIAKDTAIASKGQLFNELSKNLEESQSMIRQLSAENGALSAKNEQYKNKIVELENELKKRSSTGMHSFGEESFGKSSASLFRCELNRTLSDQTLKREEILQLNERIRECEQREAKLKVDLKQIKNEVARKINEYNELSDAFREFRQIKEKVDDENKILRNEIHMLKNKIKEIHKSEIVSTEDKSTQTDPVKVPLKDQCCQSFVDCADASTGTESEAGDSKASQTELEAKIRKEVFTEHATRLTKLRQRVELESERRIREARDEAIRLRDQSERDRASLMDLMKRWAHTVSEIQDRLTDSETEAFELREQMSQTRESETHIKNELQQLLQQMHAKENKLQDIERRYAEREKYYAEEFDRLKTGYEKALKKIKDKTFRLILKQSEK